MHMRTASATSGLTLTSRLERGLQINEIAHLLRISKGYREFEAGEFDQLPGPTYVSGYLRTYAREIGLDPTKITQRYRALLGAGEDRPQYSFPVDKQRPQRSGAMMASIVVIFAVAGYGGWYALGKPDVISSIMQDTQPEIVAAPQVETTVTEPDISVCRWRAGELVEAAPPVVEEPASPSPRRHPPNLRLRTPDCRSSEVADNGMTRRPPCRNASPICRPRDRSGPWRPGGTEAERTADETPVIPSVENGAGEETARRTRLPRIRLCRWKAEIEEVGPARRRRDLDGASGRRGIRPRRAPDWKSRFVPPESAGLKSSGMTVRK